MPGSVAVWMYFFSNQLRVRATYSGELMKLIMLSMIGVFNETSSMLCSTYMSTSNILALLSPTICVGMYCFMRAERYCKDVLRICWDFTWGYWVTTKLKNLSGLSLQLVVICHI